MRGTRTDLVSLTVESGVPRKSLTFTQHTTAPPPSGDPNPATQISYSLLFTRERSRIVF